MQQNVNRVKQVKRGRSRISAAFKGNMRGSRLLNIFHRRNIPTKDYIGPFDEYVDAHIEKLRAESERRYVCQKQSFEKKEKSLDFILFCDIIINGLSGLDYFTIILEYIYTITNNFQ